MTFDFNRHKEILHLPIDYPRLNQFPEWFTVDRGSKYHFEIVNRDAHAMYTGDELIRGIAIKMTAGEECHIIVVPDNQ